jgi:hypothetical protein
MRECLTVRRIGTDGVVDWLALLPVSVDAEFVGFVASVFTDVAATVVLGGAEEIGFAVGTDVVGAAVGFAVLLPLVALADAAAGVLALEVVG